LSTNAWVSRGGTGLLHATSVVTAALSATACHARRAPRDVKARRGRARKGAATGIKVRLMGRTGRIRRIRRIRRMTFIGSKGTMIRCRRCARQIGGVADIGGVAAQALARAAGAVATPGRPRLGATFVPVVESRLSSQHPFITLLCFHPDRPVYRAPRVKRAVMQTRSIRLALSINFFASRGAVLSPACDAFRSIRSTR